MKQTSHKIEDVLVARWKEIPCLLQCCCCFSALFCQFLRDGGDSPPLCDFSTFSSHNCQVYAAWQFQRQQLFIAIDFGELWQRFTDRGSARKRLRVTIGRGIWGARKQLLFMGTLSPTSCSSFTPYLFDSIAYWFFWGNRAIDNFLQYDFSLLSHFNNAFC